MTARSFVFALPLFLFACAPADRDASSSSTSEGALGDSDAVPTIHFGADWSVTTSGSLTSGRKVRIVYDDDRNAKCRGDNHGGPGWTVTGYYRIGSSETKSFTAAGFHPEGPSDGTITIPAAMGDTDLELWFENTSVWGCQSWDSNFGGNFHFVTHAPPEAPAWMGDVRWANTRATCDDGKLCESDRHPLQDDTFKFDDWSRSRATYTALDFRVYKPGVTDWDNGNVWQDLDVRVMWRENSHTAFHSQPVNTEKRVGNDERYLFDVRGLDPFKGPWNGGHAICPNDYALESDGITIKATIELYFTVNGVELRPAPGKTFKGVFTDARSNWNGCGL